MNLIKEHKIANKKKGQVIYGSQHGGKWNFQVGKFTLITKVRGGKAVADKIAEALHKAKLRSKDAKDFLPDGACRNVINKLLAVRTLADYVPDNDWWSNEVPANGELNVKMVHVNQPAPVKGISAEELPVVEPEVEPVPAEILHEGFGGLETADKFGLVLA